MMAGVSPPAASNAPPAGSAAPAAGPSDFTRMIKGLGPRAAPAPAAVAAPSAKPEPVSDDENPRSRRLIVLAVVLGVLAVFAIGVVLYFALRAP